MIFKVIYHLVLPNTTNLTPSIFLNMLLLLTAISLGLYLHKKKEGYAEGNALSDIKSAMKAGVPYAVLISIFIYFYYSTINPSFNKNQIEKAKSGIWNAINNPKSLAEIKKQQSFEVMTNNQIYNEMIKGPISFYKPSSTSILSLLSLILLSTIYSILVTIIFRSILFRKIST